MEDGAIKNFSPLGLLVSGPPQKKKNRASPASNPVIGSLLFPAGYLSSDCDRMRGNRPRRRHERVDRRPTAIQERKGEGGLSRHLAEEEEVLTDYYRLIGEERGTAPPGWDRLSERTWRGQQQANLE